MVKRPSGKSARVLLVEPDSDRRTAYAVALSGAGYSVQGAATFEVAREQMAAAAPEILITALRLGAFNGLHLVIHARTVNPAIAAIILSGDPDPALDTEAPVHGAVALAGFDPPRLVALVASLADHRDS